MLAAARSKLCRSVSAWSGVFAKIQHDVQLIIYGEFIDGLSLGPVIANIFVGFLEEEFFNKVPQLYSHIRYVDDIFADFSSRNEALKFQHCLNYLRPSS